MEHKVVICLGNHSLQLSEQLCQLMCQIGQHGGGGVLEMAAMVAGNQPGLIGEPAG